MRVNSRLVAVATSAALMAGGGVAYAASCPGMGDGTPGTTTTTGATGSTGTTGSSTVSTAATRRHSKRHAIRHATRR